MPCCEWPRDERFDRKNKMKIWYTKNGERVPAKSPAMKTIVVSFVFAGFMVGLIVQIPFWFFGLRGPITIAENGETTVGFNFREWFKRKS